MHRILPLIIEINILLLFFYLAYVLLFRRYTFFSLNRYYFLFSIFFSIIFPCIFSFTNASGDSVTGRLFPKLESVRPFITPAETQLYSSIILYSFYFGGLLMLIRFIGILYAIRRIHKTSTSYSFENIKFRQLKEPLTPFSFWKFIYININQHNKKDFKNILYHECVHVQHLHSIDILLAEVLTIIGWFNPAVWKLRNAIKLNLEYLTDRIVIEKGVDFKSYQYSLLSVHTNCKNIRMVNSFLTMSIQNRILMMNKKKSNKFYLACYTLIIPFIITAMGLNKSISKTLNILEESLTIEIIQPEAKTEKQTVYFVDDKIVSKSQVDQVDPKTIQKVSVLKARSKNGEKDSVLIFTSVY